MIDPGSASATGATGGTATGATGGTLGLKRSTTEALEETLRSFSADLAAAEQTAARGLVDGAGPREVADAVMRAERSLNTAIAVRDKIVQSFLEVSRMAI